MLDVSTVAVGVLLLVAALFFLYHSSRRPANLPPGPPAWPVIGHLWSAAGNPDWYLRLMEFRQQYGDVFSLYYGSRPVIVLNGHKVLRQALVENADKISERPYLHMIGKSSGGKGIIWNVNSWKPVRNFVHAALRDFGMGKASLEAKLHEEIRALFAEFDTFNGQPFNCQNLMSNATSNVICSAIFGNRFDYSNTEFADLIDKMGQLMKMNNMISVPNFIPFTSLFALFDKRVRNTPAMARAIKGFIHDRIKEHKESYDPDNIRDFLDIFIQTQRDGETQYGAMDEADAFRMIMDLFFAGTETTSTTLQWLFIYMMYHPDVQLKCRQEIHEVVGPGRLPSMQDRGRLIYTEATLLEVQRISNIAPLALPHAISEPMQLNGYTLPKGAMVIANLCSSHMDESYWGDPHAFRPERWIGDDGGLIKHTAFMPFGLGRRMCLGEQLAKMEILLFGVAFLQQFEFKMAAVKPSLQGCQGVTLVPYPFEMIAQRV